MIRDYGKSGTLQITMELHAVGSLLQLLDGLLQIRLLGRTNYFYKREPLTNNLPKGASLMVIIGCQHLSLGSQSETTCCISTNSC